MALPLYAFTLFVSAFILFLVQPIIGKIILPKLGGTPQVWNTCMVFFQMVLLAGYAYTHNATTRLTLRQQLLAHMALLMLPLLVLIPYPFSLGGALDTFESHSGSVPILGYRESGHSIWGFVPDHLGGNPIPSTLGILFAYVALPFFVVATSAPLLQKWFGYTGHPAAKDPYFLYGASNFGSMLSLILYPIFVEPMISLRWQGWVYTIGYLCLIACVMACAVMVWNAKEPEAKHKGHHEPRPDPAPIPAPAVDPQTAIASGAPASGAPAAPSVAATSIKPGEPSKQPAKPGGPRPIVTTPSIATAPDEMTFGRRFRWVMLAAIPSSLMLGITTHITSDLSPIPLFWLVPLILYLFSFILVFARWPIVWVGQPHNYMVYAQPFCLALMVLVDALHLTTNPRFIPFAIVVHVLGFFTTTMVCHGELAKDRPSTKHLTEFYLMMSVGGMVGGMFNALIAPVVFKYLWEFPLAIFAAALARPKMFEAGFLDNWLSSVLEGQPEKQAPATKPGHKAPKVPHRPAQAVAANESLVKTLDWVWPLGILALTAGMVMFILGPRSTVTTTVAVFGIPLALCCACMARPMRIGLGIGAVLLVHQFHTRNYDPSVEASRSYFGTISVKRRAIEKKIGDTVITLPYHTLVHGTTLHGQNFEVPKGKDRGNPDKDWSRLANTYYHRFGPTGRVMEKYNWFPGPQNTFWADARMPASLVGNLGTDIAFGGLPLAELVTLWSEPPYATVGLGTGTMASYARPYQHVHFYEIDNQILRLSLLMPTRKIENFKQYKEETANSPRETYFNHLERALERGGNVQVLMGDARLRMALPYYNHYQDKDKEDRGGGPQNFYHMMVVDAFSSDAIPAHLLTKQAVEMYFGRLKEDGILCVHTSNKFADLARVAGAVATDLGYAHRRGHDGARNAQLEEAGHSTSEWVMIARKPEYLEHLQADEQFLQQYRDAAAAEKRSGTYWDQVPFDKHCVWTDDYYNLLSVIRFLKDRD